MTDLKKLASDFSEQKEAELKKQLAWLIERGILVIHQTQQDWDMTPDYEVRVSQRLGLAVETERYIEELEIKISKMEDVVEIARHFDENHFNWYLMHDVKALSTSVDQLHDALKVLEYKE